jgi:hypothetical protein
MVNVKLARSSDWATADVAICTQTTQGNPLAAGASRQCTATLSLTAADITAKAVDIRAGAISKLSSTVSLSAAQSEVNFNVSLPWATAAAKDRTGNKVAVQVTITNPTSDIIKEVVLALPNNVSHVAKSLCNPNITIVAGSSAVCDLEYSVATLTAPGAVWDALPSTVLAINASSPDMPRPLVVKPITLSYGWKANITVRVTVDEVTPIGETYTVWPLSLVILQLVLVFQIRPNSMGCVIQACSLSRGAVACLTL